MGARCSVPIQTGPGAYPASYTMSTGSFPGVKWPGRGVDHPPHLAPRLKKEQNHVSTSPPRAFLICSRVNLPKTSHSDPEECIVHRQQLVHRTSSVINCIFILWARFTPSIFSRHDSLSLNTTRALYPGMLF